MDKDESIVCSICNKSEIDSLKVLTCMYCFTSAHFKCKNIVGAAVRRMREVEYFCSSECSNIYQRIISMRNDNHTLMSSFATEMKSVISASVAKEMQNVASELKQITATVEKSQEFLSAKFDEIVTDFKDLKTENEKLKREIECLKNTQNQLQSTVYKLETNVDKSDKTCLDKNAVIWGIPTEDGENVFDLVEKMLLCLGLNANNKYVTSADRMFPNKPAKELVPIRIVFCNKETKEIVFNQKKQFGTLLSTVINPKFTTNGKATTVTLRDELTPLSLELLKELRKSQGLLNIKYVWAGRGGVILAKQDDTSKPVLIKNREDLSRVINHFTSQCETPASAHSPSPKRKKNTH